MAGSLRVIAHLNYQTEKQNKPVAISHSNTPKAHTSDFVLNLLYASPSTISTNPMISSYNVRNE